MGEQLATNINDLNGFQLASLPVTPLSQLAQYAGSGRIVHVRAKTLGDPAETNGLGEKLAYKTVTQTDSYKGTVYVESERWVPIKFWIGDGTTDVEIDTNDKTLDTRYITQRVKGKIRNHEIPADVIPQLTPNFKKLKPIEDDDITVYTIDAQAPVNVYGIVTLQNGKPVLQPPVRTYLGHDVGRLIVSPFPDAKLADNILFEARLAVFLFVIITLPFLVIAGILLWLKRKERLRRAALKSSEQSSQFSSFSS